MALIPVDVCNSIQAIAKEERLVGESWGVRMASLRGEAGTFLERTNGSSRIRIRRLGWIRAGDVFEGSREPRQDFDSRSGPRHSGRSCLGNLAGRVSLEHTLSDRPIAGGIG
jgi:hypothetical protein